MDGKSIENCTDRHLWMSSISHVPQSVQLLDASIARNIMLNSPSSKEGYRRLFDVVEMAGLSEFVKSLPDGIETIVGDSGSLLSGGQK